MANLLSTAAFNLEEGLLQALLPLLEGERVRALEWSFDTLFEYGDPPTWFSDLLQHFAAAGTLIGHGVFFSAFAGKWKPEQQEWLSKLKQLCRRYPFDHITEHFGFTTNDNFHKGAPLSLPLNETTLRLGQDRLQRIQQASGCPVGIENLAFAHSLEHVQRMGDFLDRLLEPIHGFLLLDLHNLYCQSHNFDVGFERLLNAYPLARVREIHVSGGSWMNSAAVPGRKVRRDTHDAAVPDAVWKMLEAVIPRCPSLKYVVLEQMGTALETEAAQSQFRSDFERLSKVLVQSNAQTASAPSLDFGPPDIDLPFPPPDFPELHAQQIELSQILETANSLEDCRNRLLQSPALQAAWQLDEWAPHMLESAMKIAQKWS